MKNAPRMKFRRCGQLKFFFWHHFGISVCRGDHEYFRDILAVRLLCEFVNQKVLVISIWHLQETLIEIDFHSPFCKVLERTVNQK